MLALENEGHRKEGRGGVQGRGGDSSPPLAAGTMPVECAARRAERRRGSRAAGLGSKPAGMPEAQLPGSGEPTKGEPR